MANSHLMTHDISDGGLATSTQRLGINAGYHVQLNQLSLFGYRAEPVDLPRLESFLRNLKRPSFSPWTDILSTEEIAEYQRENVRKFPLLHLIPKGQSLSDLKSNRQGCEYIPGFENDCWRFVVDVAILLAGSPFGKYISVDVFRLYIHGIMSLFIRDNESDLEQKVLTVTGRGSMGLVAVFLISLLMVYKCRPLLGKDHNKPRAGAATNLMKESDQLGFEDSPRTIRNRKARLGNLLTVFFLTVFYVPVSKLAIDALSWNKSLSNECYSTTSSRGFNWVFKCTDGVDRRLSSLFLLLSSFCLCTPSASLS